MQDMIIIAVPGCPAAGPPRGAALLHEPWLLTTQWNRIPYDGTKWSKKLFINQATLRSAFDKTHVSEDCFFLNERKNKTLEKLDEVQTQDESDETQEPNQIFGSFLSIARLLLSLLVICVIFVLSYLVSLC